MKYFIDINIKTLFFACFFILLVGAVLGQKFRPYDYLRSTPEPLKISQEPLSSADPGLNGYRPSELFSKYNNIENIGFLEWQERLRLTLVSDLGLAEIFDSSKKVPYKIIERVDVGDNLERLFLTFKSFDGSNIPAYLHQPRNKTGGANIPGIIVIPGHVKSNASGIEQTAIETESYQHASALELANAGYITLTFELRGFGYLGRPFNQEHRLVAWNALLKGESYKQVELKDIAYAKKLLDSWEGLDFERIGITGVSYGGELSVQYAGLDESIKVTVFQGFTRGTGIVSGRFGSKKDQPHYCHILPYFDSVVKQEEYIWLLAPRPTLGLRGSKEIPVSEKIITEYAKGWAYENKPNNFQFSIFEGGHEYSISDAIQYFDTHL